MKIYNFSMNFSAFKVFFCKKFYYELKFIIVQPQKNDYYYNEKMLKLNRDNHQYKSIYNIL